MSNQNITSARTSINQLAGVYRHVDFDALATCCGLSVLDYGCGKYEQGREYVESIGGDWHGYDPYNRSEEENEDTINFVMNGVIDCVVCSNVLNVIDDDGAVQDIANLLMDFDAPYFVTVYERNGSGVGCKTTCGYQRNEKINSYLRFFNDKAVIRKGVLTNAPEYVI